MMKASIAVLAVAASFAAAAEEASEPATASPGKFSAEVSVDVLSDYIWRGKICNGNPVWQPSATLTYEYGDFGKVSANVWASMDLTHRRGTMNASRHACGIQELDYTLAYANSFGPVDVEIGHIWYSFPYGNGRSTEELYGTVAYNNPIATPSLTVYWDYLDTAGNDVSAVYATFALSRDFEPVEKLTVTPSAALSFADHAYTGSSGGTEATDLTLGVAASYAVTEWLSLGAQLNYTWTPSRTLRNEGYMGEGEHQIVWGGVNATLSF